MEEIRQKLSVSCPSVQETAAKRLKDKIRGDDDGDSSEAVKILWECLKNENPSLSSISAKVVVELVKEGKFPPAETLLTLMSCAPQVKKPEGLVAAVGEILRCRDGSGSYGIASKQHPFVSLLRSFPSTWPHVAAQVRETLLSSSSAESAMSSLRPVFFFAFCDPHHRPHLAALRAQIGSALGEVYRENPALRERARELFYSLVAWINLSDAEMLSENAEFVIDVVHACKVSADDSVPLLVSLAIDHVSVGLSPHRVLAVAARIVELSCGASLTPSAKNLSVLLLSALTEASSSSLLSTTIPLVLSLCGGNDDVSALVLAHFLVAVLQFMPNQESNRQLHSSVSLLAQMVTSGKKIVQFENPSSMLGFHLRIAEASERLRLISNLTSSDQVARLWLETLQKSDLTDFSTVLPTLAAMAYCGEVSLAILAFEVMVTAVGSNLIRHPHSVLALIMHKLTRKNLPADALHGLLQMLPKFGADRTCLGTVLRVILGLGARPALRALKLKLLYDLWLREDRIYVHLQKALEEAPPAGGNTLEFEIARSRVIRDVCAKKPEKHGRDLLLVLDGLVKRSNGDEEVAVSTLAMEGIQHLCMAGLIDIRTTIKVLAHAWDDHRRPVLSKFIELLSVAAHFDINSEEYDTFRKETLERIFTKIASLEGSDDGSLDGVKKSLFSSASMFVKSDYVKGVFPPFCNSDYPPGYKNPDGAAAVVEEEEETSKFVSGELFVSLVTRCPSADLDGYELVLAKLVRDEVASLPKSVYYVSPAMRHRGEEPPNYNFMPESSLLRAAVGFLQGRKDSPNE